MRYQGMDSPVFRKQADVYLWSIREGGMVGAAEVPHWKGVKCFSGHLGLEMEVTLLHLDPCLTTTICGTK